MSPEECDKVSHENVQRTAEEHVDFIAAYHAGNCYICQKPLSSFSTKTPCLHWLLKPKGFKKHHVKDIADLFGFFQIQTYLRWVANTQGFAKHINDLVFNCVS